jgi:SAM-dependent methyltransferase
MNKRAQYASAPLPYTGVDNLEVMREAENYNRYLLDLVLRHAGAATRIMDFGAGTGTFTLPCVAAGLDVTAVEPDERLRANMEQAGIHTVANVAALPDETFHFAYSLNVLEHIPDDAAALRAIRAKLAPGGRLLIYVPAFPVLYTSMDAKVGHVRRYRQATLKASVVAAGFDVEQVRYVDSLGFIATLLFKLLDNGRGDINRSMLRLYDRVVFPVSRLLDGLAHRWFGKNVLLVARKIAPHYDD